jgi:hypothetical protein
MVTIKILSLIFFWNPAVVLMASTVAPHTFTSVILFAFFLPTGEQLKSSLEVMQTYTNFCGV